MNTTASRPTAASFETWRSLNGVSHLVPVIEDRGPCVKPLVAPCATCGRSHDVTHFRTVRAYSLAGECSIERTGWPYECGDKDNYPDHAVYSCATHGVWWHEAA